MKLAIMTKSTFFVEEDKILTSLFDEGMDNLHLFKPGSSPIYSERLLTLLPEDYRRKVTVHDHYYLKQEYDLAGIHIDDPLAPVPDGYKGKYSRTCTDLSMLKEMKKKEDVEVGKPVVTVVTTLTAAVLGVRGLLVSMSVTPC